MIITLSLNEFIFEAADVYLIPLDWDEPLSRNPPAEPDLPPKVFLVQNRIEAPPLRPGEYYLWFSQLCVQRARDHQQFTVSVFSFPRIVTFDDRDLLSGEITLTSGATDVFRLSLIDRQHRPSTKRGLTVHGNNFNLTVQLDENASAIFLGNPTEYIIELDRENSLLITPV